MRLPAAILAAIALTAAASPEPARQRVTDVGDVVFLRKEGGWVLSSPRPAFPYNSEIAPRLEGLSSAAGPSPFGCGLVNVKSDYFNGARGGLGCVTRTPDRRLRLTTLERGSNFSRIYDAEILPEGFVVLVEPYGRAPARAIFLTPEGSVSDQVDLSGDSPDQAVVLSASRIAVLRHNSGVCVWEVLERVGEAFLAVASVPTDHRLQCHSSSSGGEIVRDQVTGQAYFRPRHAPFDSLYRIDDNGARMPATLIATDFAVGIERDSDTAAGHLTILEGVAYFNAPATAGPIIGQYELATGRTSRTDLRAASGRWQDARRIYGFMTAPGSGAKPRVAVMSPAGDTDVILLDP